GPAEPRRDMIGPMAPPLAATGFVGWVRRRLFGSVLNSVLTLASFLLLIALAVPTIRFLVINAVWDGASRADCLEETLGRPVGACWPFIAAKFKQFMYGFYPETELWRVHLTYPLASLLLCPRLRYKTVNAILFFGVFPVAAFFLLGGGALGLPHVETRVWGGMLVTLVISFTGIIGSLPLGILLALGRRSDLPIVRMLCVIFIEFWRGVPLVTVLFFATYTLPLVLPGTSPVDPRPPGHNGGILVAR